MPDLYRDFAYAQLTADVAAGAPGDVTTIDVDTNGRVPADADLALADFWMTIEADLAVGDFEIVKVLSSTATTLTVQRGQEGTAATAHASGTYLKASLTAAMLYRLPCTCGYKRYVDLGNPPPITCSSSFRPEPTWLRGMVSGESGGASVVAGLFYVAGMQGELDGVATASAVPTWLRQLIANPAGQASGAGTLAPYRGLRGSPTGVGAALASMTASWGLQVASMGGAAVTPKLTVPVNVSRELGTVADSFDRPDSPTIGAASDGGTWTIVNGTPLGIKSDQAYLPTTGPAADLFGATDTWGGITRTLSATGDIEGTVDVEQLLQGGSQLVLLAYAATYDDGLQLRFDGSGNVWIDSVTANARTTYGPYALNRWAGSGTSTNLRFIYRRTAGALELYQDNVLPYANLPVGTKNGDQVGIASNVANVGATFDSLAFAAGTAALDLFNVANQAGLPVATDGGTWTAAAGSFSVVEQRAVPQAFAAGFGLASVAGALRQLTQQGAQDVRVADYRAVTGGMDYVAVAFDVGGQNGILVGVDSASRAVQIITVAAGTPTPVGTYSGVLSSWAGVGQGVTRLRAVYKNGHLDFYQDGLLALSQVAVGNFTGTYAGMVADNANVSFDNFEAFAVSAAARRTSATDLILRPKAALDPTLGYEP